MTQTQTQTDAGRQTDRQTQTSRREGARGRGSVQREGEGRRLSCLDGLADERLPEEGRYPAPTLNLAGLRSVQAASRHALNLATHVGHAVCQDFSCLVWFTPSLGTEMGGADGHVVCLDSLPCVATCSALARH
eukprot:43889-Rhodomonas_salina.1